MCSPTGNTLIIDSNIEKNPKENRCRYEPETERHHYFLILSKYSFLEPRQGGYLSSSLSWHSPGTVSPSTTLSAAAAAADMLVK